MENHKILDFFKSGFYANYYGWQLNEANAKHIAEKVITLLEINSGHILDWCGGWGRISIHLAKMGYQITILDIVDDFLAKAHRIFQEEDLHVNTVNADCIFTPSDIQADHAICIFNSVGYVSDEKQIQAFKSLNNAIKDNGSIIIDCINQLYLSRHYLPVIENKRSDGITCLQKNDYDLQRSILYSEFELVDNGGNIIDKKSFAQRIYTPLELKNLLKESGFRVEKMFGSFEGEDLSFDLPQIITVATKCQ